MSVVTGITLHCSDETKVIHSIQQWLQENGFAYLQNVAKNYSGTKHPQIDLYGGGYNYFPNEEFLEFIKTLKCRWDNPENVVLIINPEEGGCEVYKP